MPALSLVVCVRDEHDLLRRLLHETGGTYDDLVVIHDGPDTFGVEEIVKQFHGRFFERPREYQQERHWPFAWGVALHDWILRLDADEFPSEKMKHWLGNFRNAAEPAPTVSGYTCIWPLWNGKRAVTQRWPSGRIFLFNRQRVRFFGMPEQVPMADNGYEPLDLILEHRPLRSSYDLHNILVRKQAYRWREIIAQSLLGKPTDLPCWRWADPVWPPWWRSVRERPFQTAFRGLSVDILRGLRSQWRVERRFFPLAILSGPVHHALIIRECCRQRRVAARNVAETSS